METDTNSPAFRAIIDEIIRYIEARPVKKWLSIREVSEVYSIRRTQCLQMISDKLITSKKIGKKVFISVASLDRYMNDPT